MRVILLLGIACTTSTSFSQSLPIITGQPQNQTVMAGGSLQFSITSTGDDPKYFQWLRNSIPIAYATNSILVLTNVSELSRGNYSVYVTNLHGMSVSSKAYLVVTISGLQESNDVAAVGASSGYSLILKSDKTLLFAGRTQLQQINYHNPILTDSGVVAIDASEDFYLYTKTNQSLYGVGKSPDIAAFSGSQYYPGSPARLATNVVAFAAGASHVVFVQNDGTLWTVGANTHGQLGRPYGNTNSVPAKISSNVVAVAAGSHTSFFIKTDQTLWGVGRNNGGELGDGTPENKFTPILISSNVLHVSGCKDTGDFDGNSFFIKTDGTLWGMGNNTSGQLGDGSNLSTRIPILVSSNFISVCAAKATSYAIDRNGILWATGQNRFGQIGDGTTSNRNIFVRVHSNSVAVAAGSSPGKGMNYALVIGGDGNLFGMGYNAFGQIADGVPPGRSTPLFIAKNVKAVTCGYASSFFLKKDNYLWAIGDNQSGQLGDGTKINRGIPINIAENVSSFSTAGYHSLFIISNSFLYAMGNNSTGQLGTGSTNTASSLPTFVTSNVNRVVTGGYYSDSGHSLFIKHDKTLWGMGENNTGQLGDFSQIRRLTPVWIASTVENVTTGGGYGPPAHGHTLFIKSDLTLWGNGDNYGGNLGLGHTLTRLFPTKVTSNVVEVAASVSHSLFIKSDGSLWAMGRNDFGQLGDGTTNSRSTPIYVTNDITRLAVGAGVSFFVKSDRTLWGMGAAGTGILGKNSPNYETTNIQQSAILISSKSLSEKAMWSNG